MWRVPKLTNPSALAVFQKEAWGQGKGEQGEEAGGKGVGFDVSATRLSARRTSQPNGSRGSKPLLDVGNLKKLGIVTLAPCTPASCSVQGILFPPCTLPPAPLLLVHATNVLVIPDQLIFSSALVSILSHPEVVPFEVVEQPHRLFPQPLMTPQCSGYPDQRRLLYLSP